MKPRKYSRNPLHVRIPVAIDETLKSMLKDEEFKFRHKSYSKSEVIRKALLHFCQKLDNEINMEPEKDKIRN